MYYVTKQLEIAGAHKLSLDYESKCRNLHGHNWVITVYCKAPELDLNGMVVDFAHIKRMISDKLDHANLNDVFDFNPTAENIARWVTVIVPHCYKCTVQESEHNTATYISDNNED